jgi:hypothetical protein
MRRALTPLALALAVLAAAPAAHAQSDQCFGETSADGVEQKPGPAMRFGITPGVQTGQLGTGPQPPRTPEEPDKQLAALQALRPPGVPFVLRLHRFFWSDREAGVQHFLELADRYTRAGYLVELQLRYHPDAQQEGDIDAWTAHVRDVVRRFGPNRRVVAIQVTNEVNLPDSPDSSDGYYERGRDALVEGVVAAKDEARKHGFDQLQIGFNWAYRYTPDGDRSFWAYIRDHGGARLRESLDWIGLDAYPGTFFPPASTPGGERDGVVNALDSLRCYTRFAQIPDAVPIHVEENGWPTSPTRTYERQVEALETQVRAFHDFRGTYNVSDYRWFNLRDGDSTSPNFQVQYGLMTDLYAEKPAFARYRDLVAELSVREAPSAGNGRKRRRLKLGIRCRRGHWLVRARGPSRGVRRVDFLVDGRRVARDRRPPFRRLLHSTLPGKHRIAARVRTGSGAYTLRRRAVGCLRAATRA